VSDIIYTGASQILQVLQYAAVIMNACEANHLSLLCKLV